MSAWIFNFLRDLLKDDLLYRIILVLIIIILSFFASKFLAFVLKKIIKPIVSKTKTDLDDKILSASGSAIYRLSFLAGIFLAVEIFKDGIKSESKFLPKPLIEIYPLLDNLVIITEAILFIALIIILLIISFRYINVLLDWYSQKIDAGENRNLSGSLIPLLKKVLKIILFALAIVIVLAKFNVDISAFVVSLGVGSLAIALAAQETLSNMISGFIIMTDRPFRIGDRIRYADNQVGDVVDIGIRSTKILDFDNNIVIIPNNEIVKSRLVNITYPNSLTRVVVDVGVAYGTDIRKVKEILLAIANEDPDCSKQIPPDVFFINFGSSSLDFRLVARTDDYKNAWTMQCRLREKIYEEFNKHNIEIPFTQVVVHQSKS
ncbi:Potassium efflux system protein KefA [Ignavibacterium album JCM 16511]|uniref:Potassium efflux system protein KefA n=1 Tax=Ignavibacterium album (strain DSM 19864 / JCM 16511 / NBRC 101810 / Mat9-16) TaxID=945713 RepID=I0ALU5_IGNAJ|nr:mechanosensitive ion channel domain-containing protein [Ignavibacterium album]AFH49952.1 Potassium efflux system protein KefA [Ignavibacterium album JCM 16511]